MNPEIRIDYEPKNASGHARRVVKNGDIVVSTVRLNLKVYAILRNLPKNVLAFTGFAVLRPNSLLLSGYIYGLLFSEMLQRQLVAKIGKGQYPSVNQADIEALHIPVPPLEVRQQIVAECETLDTEATNAQCEIAQTRFGINKLIDAVRDISATNHMEIGD